MGKHHDREETDEERRARRLAKKEAKRARETEQTAGYSNEVNPWNDPNLGEGFVWGKKTDRERKLNPESASASADSIKRRRHEQLQELEKVKQARIDREAERAAWEDEKEMLEREREQMAFVDNEKREEEFQLKQSQVRAHIRVGEGRAKPIDVLSESLTLLQPDVDPSAALETRVQEPTRLFDALNARELRELHAELCRRGQLDVLNQAFWGAMRRLCEAHEAAMGGGRGGEGGSGLHDAVHAEVAEMLAGQSAAELDELESQIQSQLSDGDAGVDTDYWRVVGEQLSKAKATNIVKEAHETMVRVKARIVEEHGGDDELPAAGEMGTNSAGAGAGTGRNDGGGPEQSGRYSPELFDEDEGDVADDGLGGDRGGGEQASGRYSPPLLKAHEVAGERAVSEEEDQRTQAAERARVRARTGVQAPDEEDAAFAATSATTATAATTAATTTTEAGPSSVPTAGPSTTTAEGVAADETEGDKLAAQEASRGMEQGEARFSVEVPLESKVTWWHDKYRPRKPKYFNRVHTGYEWNKYNQTHYDHDNPPPKMVQGYKFAVFYPDLIDRTQTPTYVLMADPDGAKDTCIIKFKGGPPYEELAFKIVNREWEHSHKRGFRCRFERGILQLHFGFKRFRYRR